MYISLQYYKSPSLLYSHNILIQSKPSISAHGYPTTYFTRSWIRFIHHYVFFIVSLSSSDCSYIVHQKCTQQTPNSCGLPHQLASHLYPTSPSKKQCSHNSEDGSQHEMGGATDNYNKENELSLVSDSSFHKMRRLSVDVVRCHHSISSQNNNMTDLSITSSMLAAHDSNDESLV